MERHLKPRPPLRRSSSRLLIGLGVLLLVLAAATGLADRPSAEPPQGFEPILVPEGGLGELAVAPTLPPLKGDASAPAPRSTPTRPAPTPTAPGAATKAAPPPSATPEPLWQPDRLVIPAIDLDAPVVTAALTEVVSGGVVYQEWVAPDLRAAGWHTASAPLGVVGNTVLNGHHNVHGEVFGHLVDLKTGDLIWVYASARAFVYQIRLITIVPERWQPLKVRLVNARWIQPARDERLTLVTCWPYTSNTHRLIIVAARVDLNALDDAPLVPRLTPHAPAP